MKRLLVLSALVIVLGAAPAGAITQSNTYTKTSSGQVTIVNTGGKVQITPAQIHIGSTGGSNVLVVSNVWTTPPATAINDASPPPIVQTNTNP